MICTRLNCKAVKTYRGEYDKIRVHLSLLKLKNRAILIAITLLSTADCIKYLLASLGDLL